VERKFPRIDLDTIQNKWVVLEYRPLYTKIFYYGKQTLVQTNVAYSISRSPEEFQNRKYTYDRYYTFIFSDSSNMGILCDSNNLQTVKIVDKDSMLKKHWAFNADRGNFLEENDHVLLSTETNPDGDFVERYFTRDKKDTTMVGSILLVLSKDKFLNIRYSMAKGLEQKRKMKLLKIEYVNDERRLPDNSLIQKIVIPYEIKELQIKDKGELLRMFNFADSVIHK